MSPVEQFLWLLMRILSNAFMFVGVICVLGFIALAIVRVTDMILIEDKERVK
jgi:hypothetical protein